MAKIGIIVCDWLRYLELRTYHAKAACCWWWLWWWWWWWWCLIVIIMMIITIFVVMIRGWGWSIMLVVIIGIIYDDDVRLLCRQSTRLPGLFSGLGTHLTWVSLTWGLSMDILLEPAPKLPHKMQKKCKQLSVKHLPSLVITCYFIQSSENASLWIHEYRMRIENTCKFDFRSVCGQFACKIHYDQLDWGCQLNTEWLWNNS